MQGLKFTLLSFAFCINLFSVDFSTVDDWTYTSSVKNSFLPVGVSASQISNVEILNGTYLQIGNDVYTYNSIYDSVFNLEFLRDSGYMLENKSKNSVRDLYYYDPSFSKSSVICQKDNSEYLGCSKHDYDDQFGKDPTFKKVEFSYFKKMAISLVSSCQSGEHFNTNTKQCQKCKENESWDPQTNSCFIDCTDRNKNMWGFTDGSCADCSGEKDSDGVKKCYCNFIGSSPLLQSVELIEGNFRFTSCQNGSQFWYKIPGTPDSDNNNTKPDNPNPGGKPNPGVDSGGGGGNPGGDIGGGSGGGNGGGGGGNGGGKEDKPSPNPGTGDNPGDNPNPNPNPGSGSGGSGNGNNKDKDKDGEAKFNKGDFDDGDLEKERNSLYNGIIKHINDNISKFDGIREGVDQFLKNVQGKGFETVKTSIKSKCPMKKEIPLPNGGSKDITVDLCEYVSPASEISYYAFYVGFAVGGFLLFLKLLIFSF